MNLPPYCSPYSPYASPPPYYISPLHFYCSLYSQTPHQPPSRDFTSWPQWPPPPPPPPKPPYYSPLQHLIPPTLPQYPNQQRKQKQKKQKKKPTCLRCRQPSPKKRRHPPPHHQPSRFQRLRHRAPPREPIPPLSLQASPPWSSPPPPRVQLSKPPTTAVANNEDEDLTQHTLGHKPHSPRCHHRAPPPPTAPEKGSFIPSLPTEAEKDEDDLTRLPRPPDTDLCLLLSLKRLSPSQAHPPKLSPKMISDEPYEPEKEVGGGWPPWEPPPSLCLPPPPLLLVGNSRLYRTPPRKPPSPMQPSPSSSLSRSPALTSDNRIEREKENPLKIKFLCISSKGYWEKGHGNKEVLTGGKNKFWSEALIWEKMLQSQPLIQGIKQSHPFVESTILVLLYVPIMSCHVVILNGTCKNPLKRIFNVLLIHEPHQPMVPLLKDNNTIILKNNFLLQALFHCLLLQVEVNGFHVLGLQHGMGNKIQVQLGQNDYTCVAALSLISKFGHFFNLEDKVSLQGVGNDRVLGFIRYIIKIGIG